MSPKNTNGQRTMVELGQAFAEAVGVEGTTILRVELLPERLDPIVQRRLGLFRHIEGRVELLLSQLRHRDVSQLTACKTGGVSKVSRRINS